MKNRLGLLFLALLLSACGSGSQSVNPYQVKADGQAAVQWADNSIQGTARAEEVLGNLTAFRGTDIANQVWGTAVALDHQSTEAAIQLTQQAPAVALQFLQATIHADATQAAEQAPVHTATAAAIVLKTEADQLEAKRANAWGWAGIWALFIISSCTGLAVFFGSQRLVDWLIKRHWLKDTRRGVFHWDPLNDVWSPIVYVDAGEGDDDDYNFDPIEPADFVSRGGVVSVSPTNRAELARATELIRTAIAINGPHSRQIPSWQEMKKVGRWTSDKWQRAKLCLERGRAVFSEPGRGTWVSDEYDTLDGVRYALEHQMIKLSPPPPEDGY